MLSLQREDWDFSLLPSNEYLAALRWEIRRECSDVAELAVETNAWLEGKLSKRKPPLPPEKRKSRRERHNYDLSMVQMGSELIIDTISEVGDQT